MRKCILFLLLIFTIECYSQVKFGFNNSISCGIGYSYVYDEKSKNDITPQHLFNIDFNLFGLYGGFGYGYNQLYSEYHHGEHYCEKINTYTWRVGPSFKIGNMYGGITITPFIGMIHYSYEEHYNDYHCHDYYCGCYLCDDSYEDFFKNELLYGGKISIIYHFFEAGVHMSNKDIGITIGFNL